MKEDIKQQLEDIAAMEQLCSNSWEVIYRFIYYRVQNREEAEDITQETFFRAISYMQKNNNNVNKFIGFLKTISLNVIRDRWRKRKHRVRTINFEDINSEETAAEDYVENMAEREFIKDALKLLSEEQRRVTELRIIKGYSVKDTAEQIGKNETNVRVIQHRALQNLARILKKDN